MLCEGVAFSWRFAGTAPPAALREKKKKERDRDKGQEGMREIEREDVKKREREK